MEFRKGSCCRQHRKFARRSRRKQPSIIPNGVSRIFQDFSIFNNFVLFRKEKLSELEKLQFLPVLLNLKVQEWKKAFKPYYYQYILPNLAVVIQK